MGYFRKKPVVIEAWKCADLLRHASDIWADLPAQIKLSYEKGGILFGRDRMTIHTLEGTMTAAPDDWVLIGVKGEVYPCKSDIFEATYEAVSK